MQSGIESSFDVHLRERQRLDEMLCSLRDADRGIVRAVTTAAEYSALTECRVVDLQRTDDDLQREIHILEADVDALVRSVGEKTRGVVAMAAEVERLEASAGEEGETTNAMIEVEAKEGQLRALEDRCLALLDGKEASERGYTAAVREHEGLLTAGRQHYARVEEEIREHRGQAESLAVQIRELQSKRDDLHGRCEKLKEGRGGLEERYDELRAIKEDLEPALRLAKEQRRTAEVDLAVHLDDLAKATRQNKFRAEKLEEAMMLVKAYVIDLSEDYEFIGAVMEKEKANGGGFENAWAYIRSYVCRVGGPQIDNERWRLPEAHSIAMSDVEGLLSAFKQMVVCNDMMDNAARAGAPMALEIIRNTVGLRSMGQECVVKYAEATRMKEQTRVYVELAKEQRKKAQLKQRFQQRDSRSMSPHH